MSPQHRLKRTTTPTPNSRGSRIRHHQSHPPLHRCRPGVWHRRGFFDTLVPPRVIAPNDVDPDLVNGRARLGCRVPVVVASPFTRGDPASAIINLVLYDHDRQERLSGWRNPIMQPRGGRCTSRSPTRFLKSCLAIAPAASLPLRSWPALVSDCNHLRHCR